MLSQLNKYVLDQAHYYLGENSEDITYRMYDLFFREYPQYISLFSQSRKLHPLLFATLLSTFSKPCTQNSISSMSRIIHTAKRNRCLQLKRECFSPLRKCMLQAVEDIMFDDATPELLVALAAAFDDLSNALAEARLHGP